jgi:hypothetical protein
VAEAVRGGAMTGGFAATGLEFVDGAFEQFADLEQRVDELAVLVREFAEELAMAAGAFSTYRHGLCLYVVYHKNIKIARCFLRKMNGAGKCFADDASADQMT